MPGAWDARCLGCQVLGVPGAWGARCLGCQVLEAQARPYIGVPTQPQSPMRRCRFAWHANRVARRQTTEQLVRGRGEERVPPIGRDLVQRGEDETALVQSRMRQGEARAV